MAEETTAGPPSCAAQPPSCAPVAVGTAVTVVWLSATISAISMDRVWLCSGVSGPVGVGAPGSSGPSTPSDEPWRRRSARADDGASFTATVIKMAMDGTPPPPPPPPPGISAVPVAHAGPAPTLPGRPAGTGMTLAFAAAWSSVPTESTSPAVTPEPARQARPARKLASRASASMAVRETSGPVAVRENASTMAGAGEALGLAPPSALIEALALPENPAWLVKEAVADALDGGVALTLAVETKEGEPLALVDGVVFGGRLVVGDDVDEPATEALGVSVAVLEALAPRVRLAVEVPLPLPAALALSEPVDVREGLEPGASEVVGVWLKLNADEAEALPDEVVEEEAPSESDAVGVVDCVTAALALSVADGERDGLKPGASESVGVIVAVASEDDVSEPLAVAEGETP